MLSRNSRSQFREPDKLLVAPPKILRLLLKFWYAPAWVGYAVAAAAILICTALRLALSPLLGDRGPTATFGVAVFTAAIVGGLGPGLVAAGASVLISLALFVSSERGAISAADWTTLTIAGITYGFMCVVSHLLRQMTLSYQSVATKITAEKEQFEAMLGSIGDGFMILDHEGEVVYSNPALAAMVGLAYMPNVGRKVLGMVRQTGGGKTGQSPTLSPFTSEVQWQGTDRWLLFRGFPVQDNIHVVVQDITSQRQLEAHQRALLASERQARSEAERSSRQKDEFVARVSHELRTPLTAMLGWLELIRLRPLEDKKIIEGLNAITNAANRQAQLVDDLLDTSRIHFGKVRLEPECFDFRKTVTHTFQEHEAIANQKGVNFTVDMVDEPIWVAGDSDRLAQVLSNLVSNATKFTSPGGSVSIKVRLREAAVLVEVKDTGIGIAADALPNIFGQFAQADSSIARKHGGLGLGLSIAKRMTDLHGGELTATSDGLGKGSTFSLRLPRLSEAPKNVGTTDDGTYRLEELEGRTAFLVDDDEMTRTVLRYMLEDTGMKVEAYSSGEEAMRALENLNPDIILSDLGMPDIDGFEMITRIRRGLTRYGRTTPAIAVSALTLHVDRNRSIACGFQAHLAKPVAHRQLIETVNSVLSKHVVKV